MKSAIAILIGCLITTALAQPTAESCASNLVPGFQTFYSNYTGVCSQQLNCELSYISCFGAAKVMNCSLANECISARINCLNSAASNTTACRGLNNLQLSFMAVAAGAVLYNESAAFAHCSMASCRWLNNSFLGAGTNCTFDVNLICVSPVNAVLTVMFSGNFTGIMADFAKRTNFANAVIRDMSRVFRVPCRVRRMLIPSSRRQGSRILVVEIEATGVSAYNRLFQEGFQALLSNRTSLLSETLTTYIEYTGSSLELLSIGIGDYSSALPTGPLTSLTTSASSSSTLPPKFTVQVDSAAPISTTALTLTSADVGRWAAMPVLIIFLASWMLA